MLDLREVSSEHEINKLKSIGACQSAMENTKCIYDKEDLVGFVDYYITKRNLHIDNIYIFKEFRYQNYGKSVVEQIRNLAGDLIITGESKPFVIGFWERMGADFGEVITDSLIEECEYTGTCLYFEIRQNKTCKRMSF